MFSLYKLNLMYNGRNKKSNIFLILEILKRNSDKDHPLTQREISNILERKYHVELERKAVSRNLINLKDMGYGIGYEKTSRINKGESNDSYSNWYFNHEFTDAELHLLIESLLFSKYIPYNQCKELIEKLKGLSNKYFGEKVKYINAMPENNPENKQLLYTVETIDEAIEKRKKVVFYYSRYGTDKKRHIVKNKDGSPREYKVSPFRMVVANARYFFLCYHDEGGLFHYRIDSITDIKLTDENVRLAEDVKGIGKSFDLSRYMNEHIHMFSGESVRVKFKSPKTMTGAVIDWFGIDNVSFFEETESEMTVQVKANEQDMLCWALQYGRYVEILSPVGLRKKVKEILEEMMEKYR